MNRFVLDWLAGKHSFLPRPDPDASDHARPPGKPRGRDTLVDALIESNRRWGLFVKDELLRWNAGETVTLIGGQQTGFAGGPLYTLAKLASLLKMKRELERRGTPATAFFWLATEDHDFAEVATLSLPIAGDKQRDVLQLRATRGVESRAAVGPLPIPESLITELLAHYQMPRPAWLREGITFRDSFAELLAQAAGQGVILVDALLPELRRAGAPLFAQIGERWDEIQREVASRTAELSAAGYTPQVVPRDSEPYTLLFQLDANGDRQLIQPPIPLDHPESISTSALTRPLLQDLVFEPDVFIGGPAEIAYYAQISTLHQLLGIRHPRVALRGHALVAPKRVVRLFTRFEIDPVEIFGNPDDILTSREPRGVAEVQAITARAQEQLAEHIEKIREIAIPADHSLARSINRSIGHLGYHFRKLSERAVRGLVRKDKERYAAARELVSTFYPDRNVQDRVVGWIDAWCRYGELVVQRMVDEIEPDSDNVAIIGI